MSKRRQASHPRSRVKRGLRTVKGGEIELLERLGEQRPMPMRVRRRFQELLP
jgi:hypothetical protein